MSADSLHILDEHFAFEIHSPKMPPIGTASCITYQDEERDMVVWY